MNQSPGPQLGLVGRHQGCANTSQGPQGPGELCRAELTKAAIAAPSREVTAAKETTRKMMMALTQRRKSWGMGWGEQGQREVRGQENIILRFSRPVSDFTLRFCESLHGETPGHDMKHLQERQRARVSQGRDAGECRAARTRSQDPGLGGRWAELGQADQEARAGPGLGWELR